MTVRPVLNLRCSTVAGLFRLVGFGLARLMFPGFGLAGVAIAVSGCGVTDINALLVPSGPPPSSGSTSASSGSTSGFSGSTTGQTQSGAASGSALSVPGKRGLAYGYNSVADLQILANRGANGTDGTWWWLNWTAHPDDSLGSNAAATASALGIEYVPMVYNLAGVDAVALRKQVPAGSKYLLTFNVANYTGSAFAGVTPMQAAAAWPSIVSFANSYNPPLKIVSPTVDYCTTNCVPSYSDPFVWLNVFIKTCPTCQIDYIGVRSHTCDSMGFAADLTTYESYGKPIWVTELWCDPASEQDGGTSEETFMQQATSILESESQVFRYGWYTGRPRPNGTDGGLGAAPYDYDILAPEAGALTPLGLCYTEPDLPACTTTMVGSE